MALTIKSLGVAVINTATVTATTLYTVPASTTAIVREITIADNASAATATVQLYRSAVAYDISSDVFTNATTVLSRQLVMSAGDVLRINTTGGSAGSASVTVSGAEIT